MYARVEKQKENKNRAILNLRTQKKGAVERGLGIVNKQAEAIVQTNPKLITDNNPGMTIQQRKDPSRHTMKPIQRMILGEYGFSKSLDLAEKHANRDYSLGFTPPTVNSVQIGQDRDIVNAFKGEDQLVTIGQDGENFEAEVNIVPTNYVGYFMYLPKPGPWIYQAEKDYILALMNIPDNGRNLTDKIELEVTGPEGHEKLAQQVEKHEKVHAKDNEKIRDLILKPWDRRLHEFKTKRQKFKGKSAEEASASLWNSVGGTLSQKSVEVNEAWGKASNDFHDAKKGKTKTDNKNTKVNEEQTKAICSYYLTI